MKAIKINIKSYEIDGIDVTGKEIKIPYDIKRSIGDILLVPQLKLNGTMLLRNQRIAQKIIDCEEDFVLIDIEEYSIIKGATEKIDVFSKNDVELIKRIHYAVEVELEEKK